MAHIQPIGNYITVRPLEEGEGFTLAVANQKERSQRGEVLKVGPGMQNEPAKPENNKGRLNMDIQEGDIVHFKHYQADQVRLPDEEGNGKEYYVISQQGILGKEVEGDLY